MTELISMVGAYIENRCRFALEVVKAVSDEIGSDCVGFKFSPFANYLDCFDSDPDLLGLYMAQQLDKCHFLYLNVTEPEMIMVNDKLEIPHKLFPMRRAFKGCFMVGGGYDRDEGYKVISSEYADLIACGRLFLTNPDLPNSIKFTEQEQAFEQRVPLVPVCVWLPCLLLFANSVVHAVTKRRKLVFGIS